MIKMIVSELSILFFLNAYPQPNSSVSKSDLVDTLRLHSQELQEYQRESLYVLCKLWGFFKYYHRYIADGNVDWDRELLTLLPKAISKRTPLERSPERRGK
jgi:hypothetical protein